MVEKFKTTEEGLFLRGKHFDPISAELDPNLLSSHAWYVGLHSCGKEWIRVGEVASKLVDLEGLGIDNLE